MSHEWPPGWYPDPWGVGGERWWDGTAWSEWAVRPTEATPVDSLPAAPVDPLPAPGGPLLPPVALSSEPVGSGSERRVWPALLAVGVIVIGALVLRSNRDDSDIGFATQTSVFGGPSTPPPVGALEVTGVAIPGDPAELLHPELTFAPNEYGITNAQLDNDGLTASGSIVLERESAEPMVLSGDAGGTFALADPEYGDLTVEIHDQTATMSWSGIDGAEGSIDVPIPAEELAAMHASGLPQSLRRPSGLARPASVAALEGVGQEQGEPIELQARGEVLVTFDVDPTDAPVKVRPDLDFCRDVPLFPKPPRSMLLSPVSCAGALNTTRRSFRTVFDVTVTANQFSARALNSAQARAAFSDCIDRLTSFSSKASWFGTAFTWLGVALAPFGAQIPIWVGVTVGSASAAGDAVSRASAPVSAPQTCQLELYVRVLSQTASQYLHSLVVQVPLIVTPLVPTYEVVSVSGPVQVRPFPTRNWNQDKFDRSGAVFGPAKIQLKKTVGTGAVEATLSWVGDTDMDLHVIDPNGAEIYYSSDSSPSGGKLDRDQIPGCGNSSRNAEHIFWPATGAPSGQYQVFVVAFDSCGSDSQPVDLMVAVNGAIVVDQHPNPILEGGRSASFTVQVP
jgi:Protein of unknown function (DUF2510)